MVESLELFKILAKEIIASVAIIIVVIVFLRRTRESQAMGHKVAREVTDDHRKALELVMSGHEGSMSRVADSISASAASQRELERSLHKELANLSTEVRLTREMREQRE